MLSYLQAFVFVNILLFLCGMAMFIGRKVLTPLRFYILSGVFLGSAFLAILLPWTIPDGATHFWIAYQRADVILDGGDGMMARLGDVEGYLACSRTDPSVEVYEQVYRAWSMDVDETLVEQSFLMPGLSFYKSINYWPMIIGILLGRVLHLGFLPMVYLARILQLMAVVGFSAYAVHRAPMGQHLLAGIGSLPISLMIMSGFSYDGMVFAVTMNFIASVLWYYRKPHEKLAYVHVLVSTALLALIKGGGYLILLPLALLFLDRKREIGRAQKIGSVGLVLALGLITVFLADKVFAPTEVFQFGEANVQMLSAGFAVEHPAEYLRMMQKTYLYDGKFFYLSMIGSYLGYLEYVIPSKVLYLATVLLVASECVHRVEVYRSDYHGRLQLPQMLILAMPILIALLTIPAMLLKDTEVGSNVIRGIQGRYYLPVYPLLLLMVCYGWPLSRRRAWKVKEIPVSQLILFAYGAVLAYSTFHTLQVFLAR